VCAHSSGHITSVNSAGIEVIAVEGRLVADSICVVAFVVHAVNVGTGDVEALVARNLVVRASKSRVASVISAWVVVLAAYEREDASRSRGARCSSTQVGRSTDNGSGLAIEDGIAVVVGAVVSIVADLGNVSATVSSESDCAGTNLAHVSGVTGSGAHAGCSTRAEAVASSSTRIAWNGEAGGLHKRVEDSSQGGPVGNGGVGCGNTWNGGSQGNELGLINIGTNTERKDGNSGTLDLGNNGGELVNIDVVHTISEYDEDGRDFSAIGLKFLVGSSYTTTDASTSSSLKDSTHCIDEGGQNVGDPDCDTSV